VYQSERMADPGSRRLLFRHYTLAHRLAPGRHGLMAAAVFPCPLAHRLMPGKPWLVVVAAAGALLIGIRSFRLSGC